MRLHTGVYEYRKRVCTESWHWEKNPLPHRRIEPASATSRSDALPAELHPHPYDQNGDVVGISVLLEMRRRTSAYKWNLTRNAARTSKENIVTEMVRWSKYDALQYNYSAQAGSIITWKASGVNMCELRETRRKLWQKWCSGIAGITTSFLTHGLE